MINRILQTVIMYSHEALWIQKLIKPRKGLFYERKKSMKKTISILALILSACGYDEIESWYPPPCGYQGCPPEGTGGASEPQEGPQDEPDELQGTGGQEGHKKQRKSPTDPMGLGGMGGLGGLGGSSF